MDSQDRGDRHLDGWSVSRLVLTVALPVWAAAAVVSFLIQGDWVDGFLTAGIGLVITGLVMAVFSQTGRTQLSPQREVAIATGQTDRRTVFESPYLRPVMLVLLALAHRLAMPRVKDWLRRTLVAEGNRNYYTAEEYLALAIGAGLAAGGFLAVVHLLLQGQFSFVFFALGLGGGLFLSIYQLYARSKRRLVEISRRVPYSLDLISLAMGAGATFTEAIQTVVHEDPEDPFNSELGTVLAEMELGATRRQALENLADRIPLDNLRTIIASIIQAEELGTPLGTVLHDQANLLRLQRSVRAENKAAVASVRILIPCLLLVFAVMLAVFGPAIVRTAKDGLF